MVFFSATSACFPGGVTVGVTGGVTLVNNCNLYLYTIIYPYSDSSDRYISKIHGKRKRGGVENIYKEFDGGVTGCHCHCRHR